MIARISTGSSPGGAVRYNEEKVKYGEARVIGINNYITPETERIGIREKIDYLEDYASLNSCISKPTFHVSLAFHPSEELTDAQLRTIGEAYMEKLGYKDQPMLLYRHEDTFHPHIHIVSVSVDSRGKRIADSHLKNRSNVARKALEIQHNLVKAEEQVKGMGKEEIRKVQAIEYGKEETKQAIGRIVQRVMKDYEFSSIDSFARVLSGYNVQMNQLQGQTPNGTPYQGITFQVRNEEGSLSPAIKASRFYFAPTRQRLEQKVQKGQKKLLICQSAVRASIQQVRGHYAQLSEADFKSSLRQADIQVVDDGKSYVYVDHHRKLIYGEEQLGAAFTRQQLVASFTTGSKLRIDPTVQKEKATPEKTAPALSQAETTALQKMVGRYYQAYRKSENIYFDSQSIRAFPARHLSEQLQREGVAPAQARLAVDEFGTYKQSQLNLIEKKEQDYFNQTTDAYLKLARQMPISPESRVQFLAAVGLKREALPTGGVVLRHTQHEGLRYPLSPDADTALLTGSSPSVPFMKPLTPAERAVYLGAATGEDIGKASHYTVSIQPIRNSLPVAMRTGVEQAFNQNYLREVLAHLTSDPARWPVQLLERGIVLKAEGATYRAGYMDSPPASYVALPQPLAQALTGKALPAPYQALAETMQGSPAGRSLVRLVQGMDSGHQARIDFVANQVTSQGIDTSGLRGELQADNLRAIIAQQARQTPATASPSLVTTVTGPQPKQTAIRLPGSVPSATATPELLPKPASVPAPSVTDVLWKDYFSFRNKNGYFYESALLKNSDAFPQTRLMTTLQGEPLQISPGDSLKAVTDFRNDRMSRLAKIEAKDTLHFETVSRGFLAMISQSPLKAGDRMKVLRALYLDPVQTPHGMQLVHSQHKNFVLGLQPQEQSLLLTQVSNPRRIELPYIEFPRHERKLYEQVATGKTVTRNPTDKKPITFQTINGERAKAIIPPIAWQQRSQELNRDTVEQLLKIAPLKAEERLVWLYQRGIVLEKTKEGGFTAGHYLTERSSFHPVSAGQNNALNAASIDPQTTVRYAGLTTERGQIMIGLARAIDQQNEKRAGSIVGRVIERAPAFAGFTGKPNELLQELSRKTGPLVEKTDRSYPVRPEKQESPGAISKYLLEQGSSTQGSGGLLDALGGGADTQEMKKKSSLNSVVFKRRKPRV